MSLFIFSPCFSELSRNVKDMLKAIQKTEKYFKLASANRMSVGNL